MIRQLFEVNESKGKPILAEKEKIDEKYFEEMKSLDSLSPDRIQESHSKIIKNYYDRLDRLYSGFIKKENIAPALSSNETDEITFDNFFGYNITFHARNNRLLMEIICACNKNYPLSNPPPTFLKCISGKVSNF